MDQKEIRSKIAIPTTPCNYPINDFLEARHAERQVQGTNNSTTKNHTNSLRHVFTTNAGKMECIHPNHVIIHNETIRINHNSKASVICVAGSPTDCAAIVPTISPACARERSNRCRISPINQSNDFWVNLGTFPPLWYYFHILNFNIGWCPSIYKDHSPFYPKLGFLLAQKSSVLSGKGSTQVQGFFFRL